MSSGTSSAALLEMLSQQLSGNHLKRLSQELGSDERTMQTAVGAALPMLLGALSRNASQSDGAEALYNALSRDHDGSLLDDLDGFLEGRSATASGRAGRGDSILGHILGSRQRRVESGLSQASGLDSKSMGKLLSLLAPIVMGALGRALKERNLDADAMAGFLGQERHAVEQSAPQQTDILGRLLDQDGDGDVDVSDILGIGTSVLGEWMRKPR